MLQDIITKYNMQKHPEGGYYSETYRSQIERKFPQGNRSLSTAIYFLLTKEEKSHFHRIKSDEGWHFYLGDPIRLFEITESGELHQTILGSNILEGQQQQYFVKAGTWFAAECLGEFSFFGCTVSPGFDFNDFELANCEEFSDKYPAHSDIIKKFSLT